MAKSKKMQNQSSSRIHRFGLNKSSSLHMKVCGGSHYEEKRVKASERKEWKNAVCSVCMEHPHNAVLLLCSSFDKGCRPYMCSTGRRYSNCLEQYKKAYTKVTSDQTTQQWFESIDDIDFSEKSGQSNGKTETSELLCPLCRGQVKGWTVVKPARKYLNAKKRTCVHDNCSFVGTFKQIRKHVKLEHPLARPREVDPAHAEKWKKLENERDLSDVFSTIRSTMPGAIVVGDYVIERNYGGFFMESEDDDIFRLPSYVGRWRNPRFSSDSSEGFFDSTEDEDLRGRRAQAAATSRRVIRPRGLLVSRRTARLRAGR